MEQIFALLIERLRKIPWYKVKTETGEEGWIHDNYIDVINWKSHPCKIGETGYISGGNLRSSPIYSVNESNILAIWEKGSKIMVIDIVEVERGQKSNNLYWFKVEILGGTCSLDVRNNNSITETCKNRTKGYINSFFSKLRLRFSPSCYVFNITNNNLKLLTPVPNFNKKTQKSRYVELTTY